MGLFDNSGDSIARIQAKKAAEAAEAEAAVNKELQDMADEAIYELQAAADDPNVDTKSILQKVLDVLGGASVGMGVPALTDDQEQLLKDFANGNVRLETAKVTNPDGTVTVLSCWADRRVPAVRRASKPTAAPTTKDDASSPTTGKDAKSSVPTPKDVATKPKSKSAPAVPSHQKPLPPTTVLRDFYSLLPYPKPEPDEDTTDDPAPAGDSAPKPEPASVTAEPVKPSLRDKLKATSAKVLDAVTEKPDAKPTHK